MIVDTGSRYEIISSELFKTQFKNYEPSQTQKCFTVYRQKDPLNCKGYFNAAIMVGNKTVNSNIYVIEGNAESLTGRDSCLVSRNAKYLKHASSKSIDDDSEVEMSTNYKESE